MRRLLWSILGVAGAAVLGVALSMSMRTDVAPVAGTALEMAELDLKVGQTTQPTPKCCPRYFSGGNTCQRDVKNCPTTYENSDECQIGAWEQACVSQPTLAVVAISTSMQKARGVMDDNCPTYNRGFCRFVGNPNDKPNWACVPGAAQANPPFCGTKKVVWPCG
jgi:hypothetical protein